jgi:RNA polymerase sigma factor (sigma-70 family)
VDGVRIDGDSVADTAMTDRDTNDGALAQLMQAAQAGDIDAYVELLRAITPRIRRIVCRRMRCPADESMDDLVQDILLSVHAVRATYDPRRPFMPWLVAIAHNRLADGARRAARRAAHEVSIEDVRVTFVDERANLSLNAYGDPEALERAIQALPRGQRAAIEMLKLRGLSLKEAAAASGTRIGALKTATHRAIASLRKMLIHLR